MTTSTFYPDPDPETTTVDGVVLREAVDETFATIRAGAGTASYDDGAIFGLIVQLQASTTSNQFQNLWRSILLFDSSSIPDADTISAAVLSVKNTSKNTGLGDNTVTVVGSTPTSNTSLGTGDYNNIEATDWGTGAAISTMSAGVYYDITLNATGIANVSKVANPTKLALRLTWDQSASFGGSWSSSATTNANFNEAQTAGTTSDPKLVVTHASAFTPRAVICL